MRSTWKMLSAKSCPATLKVTSCTSSPAVIRSGLLTRRGRGSARACRGAAPHGQRGLAHDVVGIVHLERHVAGPLPRADLDEHGGTPALLGGRAIAHQRAEMHDRDEPSPEGRDASHRGQRAGHVEHLRQVAHLAHPRERQAVCLAIHADQQVALHRPPPPPPPRVARVARSASSSAIRSAISPSGNTASTPPMCTAAVGMPAITADPLSWAIPPPPAARIARTPSAPSRPIPVSTTPTLRAPKTRATERNSGSAAGRTPHTGGSWSSAMAGPSAARITRI